MNKYKWAKFYLHMKLTSLFSIVFLMQVSASTLAQTVEMEVREASLRTVMLLLQKQTDYSFVADATLLEKSRPVTISIKGKDFREALPLIFTDQPFGYEIKGKVITLIQKKKTGSTTPDGTNETIAQEAIRGRVTDSQGRAIAGATVRVRNAAGQRLHIQSVADQQGEFALQHVPEESWLEISHIGYTTRTIRAAADVGQIILEPALRELEAVSVMFSTGYQQIPKERATGSFVQVDQKLLDTRVNSHILSQLDGIAPSVQFDNRLGQHINVRGVNTFTTGNVGALIVVDNFPYEGNLSNINPNDVASITILRDAAAASIWGAKAGNGVIVITTKSAAKDGRFSVEANSSFSYRDRPRLHTLPLMSGPEFIEVERLLFDQGFYNSQLSNANRKRFVFSPVVELLESYRKGELSQEEMEASIAALGQSNYISDLKEHAYRKNGVQRYSLALNAGGDQVSLRQTVGFDRTLSERIGHHSNRLTLNTRGSYHPSDQFSIGVSINYTNNQQVSNPEFPNFPINPEGGKTQLYPYASLIGPDGTFLPVTKLYDRAYINALEDGPLLDWHYRPLEEISLSRANQTTDHIHLGTQLEYRTKVGLSVSMLYGFEKNRGENALINGKESFFVRNLINRFSQIENNGVKSAIPPGAIRTMTNNAMVSHKGRVQLSYTRSFGEHQVQWLGGGEVSEALRNSHLSRTFGFNENTLTVGVVDLVNSHPVYDGLAGRSFIPTVQGYSGQINRSVSLYTNGAYTYQGRYIASMSLRKDASNNFGIATNQKWSPLWSAGLAWMIHKENFLQDASWINQLKIRGTWGKSGNIGSGATSRPVILYPGGRANFTGLTLAMITAPPNPHLKWEDIFMQNYALDYRLFDGLISGTVEYYKKKSSDLLSEDPIDPTTGFADAYRNVGEIKSEGIDIELQLEKQFGTIGWTSSLSYSAVKDVTSKFYGTMSTSSSYVQSAGISLTPIEGKHLYPVFSYDFRGLDPENGDPYGWDDGALSKNYNVLLSDNFENLVYHGSGLPLSYGFWRNEVRYRSISLHFNLYYKLGYYFKRSTIHYSNLYNGWTTHADFSKRWQQTGDELTTTVPSMVYPINSNRDVFYTNSSAVVEKGDHIRLQSVKLNYDTAPVRLGNTRGSFRFYLAMDQFGTLWTANRAGIDPENVSIKSTPSIVAGLSFKF